MKNKVEQTSPSVHKDILYSQTAQTETSELPEDGQLAQTGTSELPEDGQLAQTRTSELPDVELTLPSVHKLHTPIKEFTVKMRNLPHWQNPGSVYFITFRTYKGLILDDISKQIIYDTILYQDNKKCKIYSFVIMPDHVHIILQPLEIEQGEYYNLSELMQAIKGFSSKHIIKYLESNYNEQTGTSEQNGVFEQTGTSVLHLKHVFQTENFDRIIRNDEELFEKMNYILNNPVKRGLIKNGYNYKWYYINITL